MHTTPWGPAQQQRTIALGIIRVDTASHGGYFLSSSRVSEMPDALRAITPYAHNSRDPLNEGGRWYEEDCDWALVALAFPQHFDDFAIWAACETARSYPSHAPARAWLAGDPMGAKVAGRARRFQLEHATEFVTGCCVTAGDGWSVSARNLAGTERIQFRISSDGLDMLVRGPHSAQRITELGGEILRREPIAKGAA